MTDPGNPGEPLPPYGSVPPPPPPPPPPYYGAPGYEAPGYGAPGYAAPGYAGGYAPTGAPVLPYAHWGLRVGSALLDALVLAPFYILASIGMAVGADSNTGGPSAGGLLVTAVAYLGLIAFSIWNQIIRQGRTGQSLGKKWVGTRLIREDNGQPLGGWLTFGRSLLHFLDALPCYLGYLWPLWDAKKQTFADKIVKSVVVRQPSGTSF